MSADLAAPLRSALVGAGAVTALLPVYSGTYPVFTRRPAPADAPFPMILVSPDISMIDRDGVNDQRPIVERDVAVYGENDTAQKYRNVEALAYAVRDLFHRQRAAITVAGWTVVQITARGPHPAPTDDNQAVGRLVVLTIELAKKN